MSNLFSRADPRARGLGYVNWRGDPNWYTAAAANTSQQVDVVSIWLPFGVPVNSVVLRVAIAGAGTTPTGFFVGLGNATKQLAQSGNLNASAALTTLGDRKFALNAAYVPNPNDSPSGLYYVTILQNGVFGTTPVQFTRLGLNANAPDTGIGTSAGRAGTAQTALQTNGSVYSTAIGIGGGQEWWAAVMP